MSLAALTLAVLAVPFLLEQHEIGLWLAIGSVLVLLYSLIAPVLR